MARGSALSEVQISDDRMRVTLWRFPPGTETGWHRHNLDYVVVPILGGQLTVEGANGRGTYPIETAKSYSRKAGVEHNIANDTDAEIAFVEIELLPTISQG